ncbi:hypothetical protein C1280_11730 [Gemmata obscuriglobus]|uniref:Uncharacterized protein n=1 Tax=Gemmata obscuriglobus TaxID=114 RepID=A0A2Z3H3C0_9BACT|nr:hypothetical protein C1280_11730 [Gemmata obscuriglobus]
MGGAGHRAELVAPLRRWVAASAVPARGPNPALHLTPPADSGRTAHPVMAVQVSFMFGNPRVQERGCGGADGVVRVGVPRASCSA